MPLDAIPGADYHDDVYGSEFTVARVFVEEDDTSKSQADPDEIYVELDYDNMDDNVTVTLEQFRSGSNITLLEVPPDAG